MNFHFIAAALFRNSYFSPFSQSGPKPAPKDISSRTTLRPFFPSKLIMILHHWADSLDWREPLQAEAEVGEDGELHMIVRKSASSRSEIFSHKSLTPRSSNLTNVEIYSLQLSRNPTPRESSFNHNDFFSLVSNDEESGGHGGAKLNGLLSSMVGKKKVNGSDGASKDLHMFVWSSSASPVSENTTAGVRDVCNEFSFRNQGRDGGHGEKQGSDTMAEHNVKDGVKDVKAVAMPAASVMTRLILIMVWRKLIRNPNTYSNLIGLIWWGTEMPAIIARSISILSDAGLGMAMFSLGLFMALQPKMIACGNSVAAFSMAVRFIVGPVVMAVASYVVGLRGVLLHVAIVQAALPQGIVPFVFAKEYNVHPKILSTGVIFGMLIALPITLVYYILLGL